MTISFGDEAGVGDPRTFEEAVARFQEFLRRHGMYANLIWITHEDLLLTRSRRDYVRLSESEANETRAREVFVSKIDTDAGVEFKVVGFAREGLCCGLVKRAGAGVKFSVPTEQSRVEAVGVRSELRWRVLRLKYRDAQEMRVRLFEE